MDRASLWRQAGSLTETLSRSIHGTATGLPRSDRPQETQCFDLAAAGGDGAAQMTPRILIVDDDEGSARLVERGLRKAGYECEWRADGKAALALAEGEDVDVVVTDVRMPGMNGIELCRQLRARWPKLPVILMTSFASVPDAVEAMREGAFTYLSKPPDQEQLRSLVAHALEMTSLERENRFLRQQVADRYSPQSFIAESPCSREVMDLIRRVAPSRSTVLIQGESGTGKELVARLLHYWSPRVGEPFIAINCKAFAESVLESELFGHEKGAFTGAVASRAGCFERASGGTLFLDEIGEISPEFQVKLLRVLQEGEVLRVGGTQPRKVDVRVIAATNRVLREDVTSGRFREDLFFRINVIPIFLAPLRERREDILPLARGFLAQRNTEAARQLGLSPETEQLLMSHSWPGNVRELENAIERAFVLARGDFIAPEDLLLEPNQESAPAGPAAAIGGTLQEHLDKAAVARITAALVEAAGNRAEAARLLGIDRSTLYRLMARLHL